MNIRNIWKRISVETCMEVVSGWFQTSIELIEVLEIAVAIESQGRRIVRSAAWYGKMYISFC